MHFKKLGFSWSKGCNTLHDFCPDVPPIYRLDNLMLVAESQSRFELTDSRKSHSVWMVKDFLASDSGSIHSDTVSTPDASRDTTNPQQ